MAEIVQILIGKHHIGITGLKDVLSEIAEHRDYMQEEELRMCLFEKLSKFNYIPSGVQELYKTAFLREYKKYIGEPVDEVYIRRIQIKVLGAGCPRCDHLEQIVMAAIEETGVKADLEHVRDIRKISTYGIMGTPGLVINGKVVAVGSIPSIARIKEWIEEAESDHKPDR